MADTLQTLPLEFGGGLITSLSPLQQGTKAPGSARKLINFESSVGGGYKRLEGYVKYSDDIVPPYGEPRLFNQVAKDTNTSITIQNLSIQPAVGDTFEVRGRTATALVNNDSGSADTSVPIDNIVGPITIGMAVSGTGISAGTTVTNITTQSSGTSTVYTVVLSASVALTNDIELTFTSDTKTYTIQDLSSTFELSTQQVTISPALFYQTTHNEKIVFTKGTNSDIIGVHIWNDTAVVARGLDLYTSKGGSWTRISSPDYGQASVMATVDTDTSVKLTGLNQIPKIGDTFTIEDSYRDYSVPFYSMTDGRFHKAVYVITKVEDYDSAFSEADIEQYGRTNKGTAKVFFTTRFNHSSYGGVSMTGLALSVKTGDRVLFQSIHSREKTTSRFRFANFNFDGVEKFIAVDGKNAPVYYDGNSFKSLARYVDSNGIEKDTPNDIVGASFVTEFKNHIFYGNKNILAHSQINTFSGFDASIGATTRNVGNEITGFEVFRNQLIIFGRQRIQKITGMGEVDWNLQPITTDIGCPYPDTIKEIGGDIVFLGLDGIRSLSGTEQFNEFNLAVISKNIQDEITTLIKDNLEFCSVVIRGKSQYRLFGYKKDREAIAGTTTEGFIGTQLAEGFSWSTISGYKAKVAISSYLAYSTDIDELILYSNETEHVYQMEKGTTLDGSDIVARYASPFMPIRDPQKRKSLHKMKLFTDPEGDVVGDASIKFDFEDSDIIQPEAVPITNVTNTATTAKYNTSKTMHSGIINSNTATGYNGTTANKIKMIGLTRPLQVGDVIRFSGIHQEYTTASALSSTYYGDLLFSSTANTKNYSNSSSSLNLSFTHPLFTTNYVKFSNPASRLDYQYNTLNTSANATAGWGTILKGSTLIIDVSDSSMANKNVYFSTTADGTHGGGTAILDGYDRGNIPAGSNGAKIIWNVPTTLSGSVYYYVAESASSGNTGNLEFGSIPTQVTTTSSPISTSLEFEGASLVDYPGNGNWLSAMANNTGMVNSGYTGSGTTLEYKNANNQTRYAQEALFFERGYTAPSSGNTTSGLNFYL